MGFSSRLFGSSVVLLVATVGALGQAKPGLHADLSTTNAPAISSHFALVADRDDDDVDGKADADQDPLPAAARTDLVAIDAKYVGSVFRPSTGRDRARVIVNGAPLAWGEKIPAGAMLQGLAPGRAVIITNANGNDESFAIDVHGVGFRDGDKKIVDQTKSHASIERTPPSRVDLDDADRAYDDPDALRVLVQSPGGAPVGKIKVESIGAEGLSLDTLLDVPLSSVPCPTKNDEPLSCSATAPLRFVVDDVDRNHTLVVSRSIRAEVGGAIVVRDSAGKKLTSIRVGGPREQAIGSYRMSIRPVVMRMGPGGAPAIGGNDAGALAAIKQELALASATWGQCGITFGTTLDVKVVSPPPAYLVALGDDIGLPASGGKLDFKIDGKSVGMTTKKDWSTKQAALELQRVAQKAGFGATLSENARISSGAGPSVDVAVKKANGDFATVELVSSTDSTLTVSVGSVDLSDGLQHFGDTDSVAGTLEERALVKAVEDGDPRTIEVIVVPFFAGGGRIGESFIGSDGSSMRNVVIIDRAGIRARRTSFTLAHELGHVILDEPGHPDDYGIDTPTQLMDSDASDSSPFGPRRLTNDECTRAVRQAGPEARVPLLTTWKLGPLKLR